MNTVQRIAKNTGVLLISQITSLVLGFFFIMYTARYLGAEGFGMLSFALAFTGIFGVFSDLGLRALTVREVARDNSLAGKYLGNIAVMKIFLAIITFGLVALTITLLGYPEQTINVVYLVALSVILNSFSQIFYSIFQAHEKMEYQSIGQILNSILMLSGALFAISHGLDIVSFAFLYFIVSTIVLGYSFAVCVWKFVLLKIEVDWGFWESTIKEAWPFWLSGVFVILYFRIDMVMLSMMKGDAVVGWYAAPYRLINALSFIPAALTGAIYPVFSRFYVNSESSLKMTFEKSFKYLFIIAFPIGVGTTLLADKIILLIFGSDFIPSIIALQILIWTSVLIFINWTPATLLNSINKQKTLMYITGLGAIVNIVLNLILIPSFSYVGAGVATVATEFLVGTLMLSFIFRHVHRFSLHKSASRAMVAGLVMGVFLALFDYYPFYVLVLIAAVLYSIVLFGINGLEKEDINLFKQVVGG